MSQTFTSLLVHVVFSTKNRTRSIHADFRERLLAYMAGIVNREGGKAHIIDGAADHVHLLLSVPPTVALSDLVRLIKTNSSRWVHKEYPSRRAFGWQTGYSAFSVSHSRFDEVFEYIARQEEHHRKVSFKDELLSFLRKSEVEFDERYLW